MRIPILHGLNQRLKPWRRKVRARALAAQGRHEDAVVQLARSADGLISQEQLRLLYRAARAEPGPGDIAEIGSYQGRSAIALAQALRDRGEQDARVFAIDHHGGGAEMAERIAREGSSLDAFRRNLRRAGVASQVEALVMTSDAAARVLAERSVQLRLLFIDGAHDEESVRADIANYLPLMRPRGLIALHDCDPEWHYPGAWRAYVKELQPRVEELERATHLLLTRLRGPG